MGVRKCLKALPNNLHASLRHLLMAFAILALSNTFHVYKDTTYSKKWIRQLFYHALV